MLSKPPIDKNNMKMTTSGRLKLVLSTQEQRARACNKWEYTFRKLLNEEINDNEYLEIVQELMKQLQSVSNTMRETALYFDKKNFTKVSKLIRTLQQLEKEKVNTTLDIQQKILAARPSTANKHHGQCNQKQHEHEHKHDENNLIWRPRLYKEKQQHAHIIEQINDVLSEIKELKDSLSSTQHIIIKGTKIQIQTNDDCKTKEIKQ